MTVETRKTFIGNVLVGLIEKTTDAKVTYSIINHLGNTIYLNGFTQFIIYYYVLQVFYFYIQVHFMIIYF